MPLSYVLLLLSVIAPSNGQVHTAATHFHIMNSAPSSEPLLFFSLRRHPTGPKHQSIYKMCAAAWAVHTPQASPAAAVGQDTDGNLILTSGYGGDIFLNDIHVVSQSTGL